MPARTVKAALALAVVSSLALATAPAQAGGHDNGKDKKRAADLARAYVATARYLWEPFAVQDGFERTNECVEDRRLGGGMGYHYVNMDNIGSTDPARPAAVVYEPGKKGQKRQLVAVEYIVIDRDQNLKTKDDRPTMFGQKFQGPMLGHEPGMPIHYDLHVWLYKSNPKGLFAQWNPTVHCPKA